MYVLVNNDCFIDPNPVNNCTEANLSTIKYSKDNGFQQFLLDST